MRNYFGVFLKYALKDAVKIKMSNLIRAYCKRFFYYYSSIPPYEKLLGDLKGFYSRRINIKHRLIYGVNEKEKLIKVLRVWTYYE